jgi:hypothetical protein
MAKQHTGLMYGLLALIGAVGLVSPCHAIDLPPVDAMGQVQLNSTQPKDRVQLLPMKIQTDLNASSKAGDPVVLRLINPVVWQQATLPADSLLKGHVTQYTPGKRLGRRARLSLVWDEWCPAAQACRTIPAQQAIGSQYPAKITGTAGSAFKRFLPLQALSYGISIPLGLTAMPLWSTVFIEQGVGAAIGATYETINPEKPEASRGKQVVMGALNSTSLPTLYRLSQKAPDVTLTADTPLWMPIDTQLLQWLGNSDARVTP